MYIYIATDSLICLPTCYYSMTTNTWSLKTHVPKRNHDHAATIQSFFQWIPKKYKHTHTHTHMHTHAHTHTHTHKTIVNARKLI